MTNENNPGIRLIDANALLRQDDPTYDEEGFRVWYATDINRAPTVTPTFQLKDITDEDVARFAMIWQRATSKGVILEPERPHGEWIRGQDQCCNSWFCSICNTSIDKDYDIIANYCPYCGARMQGGAL